MPTLIRRAFTIAHSFSYRLGLKVIVIIEYVATHDLAFPTNDILKEKYRHDLARLVDTVRSIAVPRKEHPLSYLAPDGTPSRIVRKICATYCNTA